MFGESFDKLQLLIVIIGESESTIGRRFSLPSPAARSDSSRIRWFSQLFVSSFVNFTPPNLVEEELDFKDLDSEGRAVLLDVGLTVVEVPTNARLCSIFIYAIHCCFIQLTSTANPSNQSPNQYSDVVLINVYWPNTGRGTDERKTL